MKLKELRKLVKAAKTVKAYTKLSEHSGMYVTIDKKAFLKDVEDYIDIDEECSLVEVETAENGLKVLIN